MAVNIYEMEQTWNNAATVFEGIKLNVTDTASSPISRLINLAVNGTPRFIVDKNGQLVAGRLYGSDGQAGAPAFAFIDDPDTGMYQPADGQVAFSCNNGEVLRIVSDTVQLSPGIDLKLGRAAVQAGDTPTATHTLQVKDSSGTVYHLLAVADS